MCANRLSILVTVSLVVAATVIIIEIQHVQLWALAAVFAAWIACFCCDALYTLRFGRELILRREVNVIFRILYRRVGVWAALAHFGLELAGIAALSLILEHVSAGSLERTVLAAATMLVLAGEHVAAFFENRAFARQIRRDGYGSA